MISVMMPWKENVRGTSALPYHLLVHRDKNIKVTLYSFNMNRLSDEQVCQATEELGIETHILPTPWWYKAIFLFHLLFLRIFLPVPIGNYIKLSKKQVDIVKAQNPDGIWIYGEELSRVSRQFGEYRRVHTLPDCEALYYYRLLSNHIGLSKRRKFWRYAMMYSKFVNMNRHFDNSPNVICHVVGDADADLLKVINPNLQVRFILHPHYEVPLEKIISFDKPKIKILIAGQNNLYMADGMNELTPLLCDAAEDLSQRFIITFLGRGWESHAQRLKEAGWESNIITFATDYTAEVCRHDIQIVPITIGTGTKGKVLDALCAGLLVIGTPYAIENIAVENGKSCIIYRNANNVVSVLREVVIDDAKYESIALAGRNAVLAFHSRTKCSKDFFSLFTLSKN